SQGGRVNEARSAPLLEKVFSRYSLCATLAGTLIVGPSRPFHRFSSSPGKAHSMSRPYSALRAKEPHSMTYRKALPLLAAVLAVNLMSVLDAISTLLLVDNDACVEVNPLMSDLMGSNYLHFLGVQLGVTFLGTLICWHYYEQRGSARWTLKFISRTYCAV